LSVTKGLLRNIVRDCVASEARASTPEPAAPALEIDPDRNMPDGFTQLARASLFNISFRAQSMHDRLQDEDQLPEWVQSSISTMLDDMYKIEDYIGYKIHRQELEN
jgi:hypothetical protein